MAALKQAFREDCKMFGEGTVRDFVQQVVLQGGVRRVRAVGVADAEAGGV